MSGDRATPDPPDPTTKGTPPASGPAEPPPPPPPPSPQWVGAVVSLALLAAVIWLLGYTLLDLGWQQRLSGWNYLIATLLSSIPSQVLQRWKGDPRRG